MIQENEMVNLFISIAAIVILFFMAKKLERGNLHYFYAGFAAMSCAYTTTILEGYFWHDIFNLIEHISLAVAGILFAVGCWFIKQTEKGESNNW